MKPSSFPSHFFDLKIKKHLFFLLYEEFDVAFIASLCGGCGNVDALRQRSHRYGNEVCCVACSWVDAHLHS